MKAIRTKYFPPGNVRGAKIKATDGDGNSVTIDYPHDASSDKRHFQAALALCRKMRWYGTLAEGWSEDRKEGVFVWTDDTCHKIRPE